MDSNQEFGVIDGSVTAEAKTVVETTGESGRSEDPNVTLEDHVAMANKMLRNMQDGKAEQNTATDESGESEPLTEDEQNFQDELTKARTAQQEDEERQALLNARGNSRAGQDLAIAMQIADEKLAMAEAISAVTADNPIYVVHGATMVCSMGTNEARLVVPLDHGVYAKGHPQLTVEDCKSLVNIKSFINCMSPANPLMEQAAIEAVKSFNEEHPGIIDRVKSWFGIKPKEKEIKPSKELLEQCICECIPDFAVTVWGEGNTKNLIDGVATLGQTEELVCLHGGKIKIYLDGQDE